MAWAHKFLIKDMLDEEEVSRERAKELGEQLAKRLETPEAKVCFGGFQPQLVEKFRTDCFSQADFNHHLDFLYDVADERRVWID